MPDQNTIPFAPFQLNIEGLVSWVYTHFFGSSVDLKSFLDTATTWWYIFSILSFVISALLLIGIVYAMIRFAELREIENEALREAERAFKQSHATEDENTKWQSVMANTSSESPTDWRVAIIEAAIRLRISWIHSGIRALQSGTS